jgi:hypothetical protein
MLPPNADGETDPLVTEGAPRSFRVVSVPIPAELTGTSGAIQYSVVPVGSLRILGAKQGSIAITSSRRDVVFTIAIPSSASAHRVAVGYVTFSAPGVPQVRVPVNLEVTPVYRITMEAKRDVVGVHPGQRVTLGFSLQNDGNTDDTLTVALRAPDGWGAKAANWARVVVPTGAHVDHNVTVSVPPDVGTGSWFIDLVATRGTREVARSQAALEVAPPISAPIRTGPALTGGVVSVFSRDGLAGTVETVALDGTLVEGVRITGRYTSPVPRDGITDRALAQLGYSSRANSVALRAPGWGLGAGMTGIAALELAGSGIFGRGASVAVRPGPFALQATAVTPVSVIDSTHTERNLAVRGDWSTAHGMVTISATHLRDAEFNARQLDAFAVGASGPLGGTTYLLEAAQRRHADGSGYGALAEIRGNNASGDFSLRAMQAPGGTGAFAASRSGMFASAGHRLGSRLDFSGSAWRTDDGNASFSSLRSSGWAVTPRVDVTRALSLGADVHGTSYTSSGAESAFGTSMTSYGLRASVLNPWVQLRGDVAWSRMLRDASVDATTFRSTTDRATVQTQLDLTSTRGRIGIGTAFEASATDLDERSQQTTIDFHVEQFVLFPRFPGLKANVAVQRFGSNGVPAVVLARGGIEVPMAAGFRFRVDVDHSGVASSSTHGGTIISTRLERTMGLPFVDRRTERGVVFQDLNGNGHRDDGEPGFSGAILRRGAESAMSDRDGEYRLLRGSREPVELDARTLPAGWILSQRASGGARAEFGVVPTAALEVSVLTANDSVGASQPFRFGSVTVALIDSAGRKWVVQTETRRALFDALPAGSYRMEAEAAETSEPLLVDVPAHVDVIAGSDAKTAVTIRRRPVKIFRSASPSSTPKTNERRP